MKDKGQEIICSYCGTAYVSLYMDEANKVEVWRACPKCNNYTASTDKKFIEKTLYMPILPAKEKKPFGYCYGVMFETKEEALKYINDEVLGFREVKVWVKEE